MDLKQAATAAKATVGKEPPYTSAILAPGEIETCSRHAGTIAPCADVKAGGTVDAVKFLAVATKGKASVDTIERGKLVMSTDGGKFTLPLVVGDGLPPVTRPGPDGWFALSEVQVDALVAVARIAGKYDPQGLGGRVLLGDRWAVGCTGPTMAVAWTPCAPTGGGCVVGGEWLDGHRGAIDLLTGVRVWTRDAHGVLRWCQSDDTIYPEASVGDVVRAVRQDVTAWAGVDLGALYTELEKAALVVPSPVWPVRLTLTADQLHLTVKSDNTYASSLPVTEPTGAAAVLLPLAHLLTAVKALAGVSVRATISFAGPTKPVTLMVLGEAPIEVILTPTVA